MWEKGSEFVDADNLPSSLGLPLGEGARGGSYESMYREKSLGVEGLWGGRGRTGEVAVAIHFSQI